MLDVSVSISAEQTGGGLSTLHSGLYVQLVIQLGYGFIWDPESSLVM